MAKILKPFPPAGHGMYYRTKHLPLFGHLLTPGRRIRWSSTGAEYGLIDAIIAPETVRVMADVMVQSAEIGLGPSGHPTGSQRSGIYIEQVAEIYLTPKEWQALHERKS